MDGTPNHPPKHDADDTTRLANAEYRQGTEPFYMRWDAYEFSTLSGFGKYDYYTRVYDELDSDEHSTIIDVGGGDGRGMLGIKLDRLHIGPTIVVDIHEKIFEWTKLVNHVLSGTILGSIACTVGRAENLAFADNSIDAAMALFSLYHVGKPEVALDELRRVTKPGAKIGIATSGPNNKIRQREFENEIADYLGIEPPPRFTEPFDTTKAHAVLSKYFRVTQPIEPWRCAMRVPYKLNQSKWSFTVGRYQMHESYGALVYLSSLNTMRIHFKPEPSKDAWAAAIAKVVLPRMGHSMAKNGYFEDEIDREFYICENIKSN